ncbi:type 1 fimbria pilin [Klebsiella oxytoca]|uniref:Type 1 fimbria pilin n=1 Tax=Klebsiella oxytoca TaxID=571 RepID=A0A318FLH0_KLEOX|nr:fimbrial protein [Klebsiella oxytoca]PXW44360.1 type 1 fimbria pilin [Klebsiella oxytoca]
MKRVPFLLLQLLIIFWFVTPAKTYAFACGGTSNNVSYTYFPSLERDEAVTIALPPFSIKCNGFTSPNMGDALRIVSVTLNSKLINSGFVDSTLSIADGGTFTYPFSDAINKCVWIDQNCGMTNFTGSAWTKALTLTLKRAAGTWPDLSMYSGENLITVVLQQRGYHTHDSIPYWGPVYITMTYRLREGSIIPQTYTCDINTYDNTVDLPAAKVSDILAQSPGKVSSSKTRFNIQLGCKAKTRVSLQFTGTTMSDTGTDDVLVNQIAGNENIGIQLYRADAGTAITFNNKYLVINSADATENLDFDAYYYYKGGSVVAGIIKSISTFTFSYE